MHRSDPLQPLSRQHHIALVFAKTLRQWERLDPPPDPGEKRVVGEAAHRFWEVELVPHFRAEEEGLLGRWHRPGTDSLVTRVLQEHVGIHRVAQRLGRCLRQADIESAWEEALRLGQCVNAHVRFEERHWLPELEAEMDADLLAEAEHGIGHALDPEAAERALPPRPDRERIGDEH
ncbi:hemerythrin domain-containing protein [Thiohalorhabdus methylotrophus]|uniref:Hemerythrin domain-containing protein n=1 Tax=Thiohalorhabdus methylotrophus TaxID=3242694 RepID=A0ABV4TRU3_9GAMM